MKQKDLVGGSRLEHSKVDWTFKTMVEGKTYLKNIQSRDGWGQKKGQT